MNFQVETHVGELAEEVEQGFGPVALVVECTVEHPDVTDTFLVNQSDTFADCLDRKRTDRLFSSAYAECAGVETAAGSFQLHERLAPVEERTLFGIHQLIESHYTRKSVVMILSFRIQEAESRDASPFLRLLPAGEPLRESLFTFSTEHAVYKAVGAQEVFVVSQELRTAQCHHATGQHGFYPTDDVHEHFVVEQPAGSCQNIRCLTYDFSGCHARIFVDSSRHHSPFQGRVVHDLCVQGRKGQRGVSVRAVQVEPENFHG